MREFLSRELAIGQCDPASNAFFSSNKNSSVYINKPQYLTSKFTKRSNIHTRNTRTRNSLQIPLYRTAIGQRTFSYRGAYTWNNLHNELRQSASLASFKRALKDTLLRQTFPS